MEHKEQINYIVEHHKDGRVSYTGQSVNYGVVCSSWESVEDLQNKMKAMIEMWIDHAKSTVAQEDPLEMKECTEEEWEAKDDNIDYWEIERIKRVLKRPSIQTKWKKIIAELSLKYKLQKQPVNSEDIAQSVIDALINQENE